jgi:hypothetical protein
LHPSTGTLIPDSVVGRRAAGLALLLTGPLVARLAHRAEVARAQVPAHARHDVHVPMVGMGVGDGKPLHPPARRLLQPGHHGARPLARVSRRPPRTSAECL